MNDTPVDVFVSHLYEAAGEAPNGVLIQILTQPAMLERLTAEAQTKSLHGAAQLLEQAVWAWVSTGLIGLSAYLVSRQDVWTLET